MTPKPKQASNNAPKTEDKASAFKCTWEIVCSLARTKTQTISHNCQEIQAWEWWMLEDETPSYGKEADRQRTTVTLDDGWWWQHCNEQRGSLCRHDEKKPAEHGLVRSLKRSIATWKVDQSHIGSRTGCAFDEQSWMTAVWWSDNQWAESSKAARQFLPTALQN
jgi:hypothetical protein